MWVKPDKQWSLKWKMEMRCVSLLLTDVSLLMWSSWRRSGSLGQWLMIWDWLQIQKVTFHQYFDVHLVLRTAWGFNGINSWFPVLGSSDLSPWSDPPPLSMEILLLHCWNEETALWLHVDVVFLFFHWVWCVLQCQLVSQICVRKVCSDPINSRKSNASKHCILPPKLNDDKGCLSSAKRQDTLRGSLTPGCPSRLFNWPIRCVSGCQSVPVLRLEVTIMSTVDICVCSALAGWIEEEARWTHLSSLTHLHNSTQHFIQ